MSDRTNEFYAAEDGIHGYGGQLLCGNGASPEVFEAVAAVTKISLGTIETSDMETTHLRSPNRHKEHRAGIRDSGRIEFECIWLPDEQSHSYAGGGSGAFANGGLLKMAEDGENRNWKVVLNDGSPATELPIRAYVARFQPGEINNDGVIMAAGALQPTQSYVENLP